MAIDTTADHGGGAGAGGVDIPMQILVQPPPLPPPTATATARHRRTHTGDSTASSYEPQRRPVEHQVSSMHAATASDDGGGVDDVVPERKVTAFALHVAVLEKAASHVGAVCFVWATVVILGGFAADLDARDFWLVTAILLVEGTRVFSRSNELDLQEQPMHLPDAAAAAAGDDDQERRTVRVCFFANTRHLMLKGDGAAAAATGFYGNCFYPVAAAASGGEVAGADIVDVVRIVRDAKARLAADVARWAVGGFEEDPYELTFTYDSLFVSDWTRLGFLDADYGWGTPSHVVPFSYHPFMAVAVIGAPPAPKLGARVMTMCVEEAHLPEFRDQMNAFAAAN